jgi:hypothetical protein
MLEERRNYGPELRTLDNAMEEKLRLMDKQELIQKHFTIIYEVAKQILTRHRRYLFCNPNTFN